MALRSLLSFQSKLGACAIAGIMALGALTASEQPAQAMVLEDPDHIQWIYLAGSAIPSKLYSAGLKDDQVVRVCRVRHRKDFEIGYIKDSFCQIGGDGMSRPYSEYEVLVFARNTSWYETKRRQLPPNAEDLSAGLRKLSPLHLCRIHYEGNIAVGTINGEGYCIAGYATGELKSDEFDILVSGAK